jgi:hypothetical protein
VSHGDLRIVERSLRTAAACADADGFVAGQGPGATQHLASYSALWPGAVLRHAALSADDRLLDELAPAAARNAAAFVSRLGPEGIGGPLPWPFVDWGAAGDELPIQLLALDGLESSGRWLARVWHGDAAAVQDAAHALRAVVERRVAAAPALGYHTAALALGNRVLDEDGEAAAVQACWTTSTVLPDRPRRPAAVQPSRHGQPLHHAVLPALLADRGRAPRPGRR